jgi:hypothetical protein
MAFISYNLKSNVCLFVRTNFLPLILNSGRIAGCIKLETLGGNTNPSNLSHSESNLTEFWRGYPREKGRVQNCRGTPNFKVA